MTSRLSRRQFLAGLCASTALVPVIRALPITVGPFDAQPDVIYPPLSITKIRDLLMPGLTKIRGDYGQIESQWAEVFGKAAA